MSCLVSVKLSRKILGFVTLVVLSSLFTSVYGQSSNKGTEFWIGFPNHAEGTQAGLYLYITGDSNTTGTVSVPGQSWSSNFSVTADSMTLVAVPSTVAYMSCSDCQESKGIKVESQKKVVVYSHIYRRYRSDATLVLPTRTLGKKYYCMSYEQYWSSERSQFMIVAAKDDTKVRITPTVALAKSGGGSRAASTPYEITLDAGECYQGRAQSSGRTQDVSGTLIEVIDTGSTANCRTVAVFSGSSGTNLGCNNTGWGGRNSRDNLYQQMYPVKSWGQFFITVPFKGMNGDDIRFLAAEDNTTVTVFNGTGAPKNYYLDAGDYDGMEDAKEDKYIVSNKPIMVAQYQQSQRCNGNNTGDPSMTILNPVEQTLKKISVYSSEYEDIDDHYINVIIPNSGIPSFRIDGKTASFTKCKRIQSYSYARIDVSSGNHELSSNVGFNAVAYGFGSYESYGYSAGANVKDLRAVAELTNSTQNDATTLCLGQTAEFAGTAEYTAKSWFWQFGDGDTSVLQNPKHTYADTGTYEVKLYVYKPADDGCSIYDSSILEVRVNAPPIAKAHFDPICMKQAVNYTDSSYYPPGEKQLFTQFIFHDNSTVYSKSASKTYDTTGKFLLQMIVATQNQCRDTFVDSVTVNPNPIADFTASNVCSFDTTHFTNTSILVSGGLKETKWYFGDGDSSLDMSPSHFYQDSGTYFVELYLESDSGCVNSAYDTITKYARFGVDFVFSDTCAGLDVDFTNTSFADASSLNNWSWTFPGGTTYATENVTHSFSTPGTYAVTLSARWDTLCYDSVTHQVQVDPNAQADFSISSSCLVDTIRFINTSTITGGTISGVDWDLDDGFTGTSDTMDIKYASKGSKDIQLIVTTDQGCEDTTTINIDLVDPRITSFNIPNICENLEGIITANVSLDGDNVTSWNWDADGTTSTTDTLKFTSSTTGRYPVRLDLVTGNNCNISYDDTLDVYATPVAVFTVDPVCSGEDLVPVNNSSIQAGETIASYNWYVNNSFETAGMNPTLTSGVIGTNTIRLIATSQQGCNDAQIVDVDIYPLPNPSFIIADSCLNETTRFSATSTISSGSISTNQWTYNDGTTDNGSSITRLYPAIGEYSVTLVSTSAFGCVDSTSQSFNIHPLPQLSVTLDPSTGCQPLLVTFTNTSTIASGTIDSYEYDFGDGSTGALATTTHNYPNVGTYTVRMKGTSNIGCVDSIVVSPDIVVQAKPTAAFSWNPFEPSLLYPDIDFINESSADATSFEWSISNGMTFNDPNPSTQLEPGDYTAQLIAIATNGCRDTITADIYVKLDFFVHAPTAFSPNGDLVNDQFGIDGMIDEVEGYSLEIFNMWGELVFSSDKPTEKWDGTYRGKEIYTGSFPYVCRFRHYETQRWVTLNGVVHIIK